MAYTDLSATWVYKKLITHQLLDQHGENDKVFNDLLTAVTDFSVNLKFDNNKGITGEIAAGSTYKNLLKLDASNIAQLGESGTEVRVPADPTNALGVATKQYVDATQMLQTQAKVAASSGASGTLATILNLAATTRGVVRALYGTNGGGAAHTLRVKITVDGTVVIDKTSAAWASTYRKFLPGHEWDVADFAAEDDAADALLAIHFNSSLLIEAASSTATVDTVSVVYAKIP